MPVKIAHITLSMGTGGIENLILDLCKNTNKDKFDISVICLDSAGNLFNELKPLGINGFVEQRHPGLDWRLILRLVSFFRSMQVEVVHSHNQACAFYAGIAAFLARVPVSIVTEHSRNYIQAKLARRREKKILSLMLDKWVNVSYELATHTIKTDKINSNKVEVILNGVECDKFINPQQAVVDEIRNKYQLNELNKIIVMVARLNIIKNHALMIDALSLLVKDIPDVKLILVGDGECREDLEKKVSQLGLPHKVLFLGLSKNIPEILTLSDVFVLCSHSEGLPLALLEASAANVPVVITENSNGAQFIKNMEKGIVVKDDAFSLAMGIKECLTSYDQANKMSTIAQKDVIENYSLESTVKQYEKLYLELLARTRKSRV